MNDSLFPKPVVQDDRLPRIHKLLLDFYGKPEPRELWDPLTQFIYSLLSSRTKSETTLAAVRRLQNRFGTWENLRDAPLAEIEATIADINFPEQKAINLKASLQQITVRYGTLTLDFLASYRTDKIRAWLEQFPGVGPKTSGAVVNFSVLRRRALCLDTHHLRIVQRLGLVRHGDVAMTEERLMRIVPESWDAAMLDEDHQLIKRHGQEICTFSDPKCSRCPLLSMCPYGQKQTNASVEPS
jgi:endonuclease-3